MTAAAWLTLALTWAVIGFFTGRFFLRVVASGRHRQESVQPEE